MSSQRVLAGFLFMFLASMAVETCSGQIFFRRRREALKAEMKWELQQQLDANLNSQVESARTDLAKSASEQIQQEAASLRASLKTEIASMRAEADKIVADEKARIAKQAAQEIAKFKTEANKQVVAVKKELKATTTNSIAAAEDNLKKALADYSKVLSNQNKEAFVKFESKTADQFKSMKSEMESFINKDVTKQVETAIKKQVAASNKKMEQKVQVMIDQALAKKQSKEKKQPGDKKKKSPADKKAVINRLPRITEESVEDNDA